jgi:polyisoprenoid-binding protein YceI
VLGENLKKVNLTIRKMNKLLLPIVAGALFVTSAFVSSTTLADDFKIKDGFKIAFKSKDPSGSFTDLKGIVKFDEADLAGSKFDLTINIASISTGNGLMNKKAQTEEWFQASKYPTIKFISTAITKAGSDYVIAGNLTMKGVTKEKKIPAKLTKNGGELLFSGAFPVNRMDYKIGKKSDAVPDIMNITYAIPVTKK